MSRRLVWSAVLTLGFTQLVHAADAPPTDAVAPAVNNTAPSDAAVAGEATRRAAAGVTSLGDTVVTATRTETPTSEVGSSISVIPNSFMDARQDRFILDPLRTTPGVDIVRTGGMGSQTSIFTRGTENRHTLVLVDGVRLHDPSNPNGTAVIDNLTTDNVERIEVLRGPQSTLYGPDAIGGVINVQTKKGQGTPTFSAFFEAGSFSTYREGFSSQGGNEHFNYSVGFSHMDSASIPADATDPERDPYRNTSFNGRFGVDVSDTFGVDFFIRAIDASVEGDFGADFNVADSRTRQQVFKVEPHLLLFNGFWETKVAMSLSQIQRHDTAANFLFFPYYPDRFEGRTAEIDWQNTFHLSESNTLIAGFDFLSMSTDFSTAQPSDGGAEADDYAVYLQDQQRFGERLSVTIGGRVDHHDQFGTAPTGRIAGAYQLLETHTILRSSIGTGFRAPTPEQLFDVAAGANPALQPERSVGIDAGFEQHLWTDKLVFSATYFQNWLEGLVISTGTAAPPFFTYVNGGQANTNGAELAIDWKILDDLTARASYTYTHTELEDANGALNPAGSRLVRRPEHKASLDFIYEFFQKKGQVTLSILYVGERDDYFFNPVPPFDSSRIVNPDYVVVNLAASYKLTDNVTVFGRIENLLNENYQELFSYNSPGVGFFGGFKVTF
jgi:vitamin B12 transporter